MSIWSVARISTSSLATERKSDFVKNSIARLVVGALVACILLYFFPLVRIRSLGSAVTSNSASKQNSKTTDSNSTSAPDVAAFIETLWTKRLPAAATKAARVDDVLAMAARDAGGARKKFGRDVGLGGPTFLFLQGSGQIQRVNEDECVVSIDGQSQPVVLEIGILVSNAIRDATGLANVGDFANSQDFNQLSTELNSRCESEVIEPVRDQLVVGAIVEFVGCGEVRDTDGFKPLKLIPVQLKAVAATETAE